MDDILKIIKDTSLTYEQKVLALAKAAENSIKPLKIDEETQKYREAGVICDLNEGSAPYRPRYIVPDYEVFLKNGSKFLGLEPPRNIWEAVNSLLILYKHVPSITSFPVYLGNIDTILDRFIEDEEEAYQAIKLFLLHIDRTITDSFCHANIGPEDTKAGRLILKASRELNTSIPNLTLKYSKNTPDDLVLDSINTALITAKPSFANHEMFAGELGEDYAIASCYNGLPIGGGNFTLVRLNMGKLAPMAKDTEDFINNLLPDAVEKMAGYMDERIKFLMEESGYFESSFLVKEGLISADRFTSMFGMVGLADAVNHLLGAKELRDRFGHSKEANDLGVRIIEKLEEEVNKHHNPYCKFSDGKFLLHAQVGIDTDKNISPGCRIPIGEEPEIWDHLKHCALFHKYFPTGIGDIFRFDSTVKRNPQYVLDIMKGAMNLGVRYISFYTSDSDVVRITGYLVKRSDMEKLERGEQVLNGAAVLGLGAVKNQHVLDRKERKDD
ncbi:YjjI family glycine radical enzyme [Lutispora thermophila]|uniref:Glycine radical enzyme, YjjI family n=1 Tax=Lutispora thermophila DSM 19022 TaxID=1122184 RepID=A0A1M6E5Z3_9FIRM|nr:YjjI family glycine radical enzyme [Lutispora thermophila]SHI80964.1 glycine radical enzyme, YjjI family [Lutispora thermophila DSM 19022]